MCREHLRPVPAIGKASKSAGRVRRNGRQPLHGFYGASIFVVIRDSGKNGQLRGDQEKPSVSVGGPGKQHDGLYCRVPAPLWDGIVHAATRTARADLIVLYLRPRE